ncbi:hypothetical protein ACLMJK_008251 [Lecanora helva]
MSDSTKATLETTISSSFIPPLPAKAFPPAKPIQPKAPLVDEPVGDQVMPTDEMIQATATKSRSSSSSTLMSMTASDDKVDSE